MHAASPAPGAEFDADGNPDQSTMKPMVDGGTEGFKARSSRSRTRLLPLTRRIAQGHARVIVPGVTPCFQCTMWLFPPQTKFPLCTLAETPRSAAHCIEYAHLIAWGAERPGDVFDADNAEHMKWIFDAALSRAEQFGIPGVTLSLTQGVVKNIIPAIPSTNAIVSAACALEVLKMATMCSQGCDNYMMYNGTEGVYTHTTKYERAADCVVCSAGVPLEAPAAATLSAFLQLLQQRFPQLSAPSVSHGARQLFARGVFEEDTRANLGRTLAELLGAPVPGEPFLLTANDKRLPNPLRLRLTLVS